MTALAIPDVTGPSIQAEHYNNIQDAVTGDILPRDSSGNATDLAADLGTSTYPFLKMFCSAGEAAAGFIKKLYDFAGTFSLPAGYMLCNGDQVTQAAYNIQHRTGVSDTTDYWSLYVGSSPLQNKYLPSLVGRYVKGSTSATQDGLSALTYSGAPGNNLNLAHTHGGSQNTEFHGGTASATSGIGPDNVHSAGVGHRHSFSLPSRLSSAQSIRPESIEVKYIMRIVE